MVRNGRRQPSTTPAHAPTAHLRNNLTRASIRVDYRHPSWWRRQAVGNTGGAAEWRPSNHRVPLPESSASKKHFLASVVLVCSLVLHTTIYANQAQSWDPSCSPCTSSKQSIVPEWSSASRLDLVDRPRPPFLGFHN